jgi:hypothetical protein
VGRGLALLHLLDDGQHRVDRDREAQPDGARLATRLSLRRLDRCVDADQVAVQVHERAAAVAGVDGGIGLDRRVDGAVAAAVATDVHRALEGADDAGRHGRVEPEGRPDGHDGLADLE